MILTVTLNPAFDLTLEVPGWEVDAVNRATRIRKENALNSDMVRAGAVLKIPSAS